MSRPLPQSSMVRELSLRGFLPKMKNKADVRDSQEILNQWDYFHVFVHIFYYTNTREIRDFTKKDTVLRESARIWRDGVFIHFRYSI